MVGDLIELCELRVFKIKNLSMMLRNEMGQILEENNEVKQLLIWTRNEKLFPIFY
jgi:hypothetical protein